MATAQELYAKYEAEIKRIISIIKSNNAAAIPGIVTQLTTVVVPNMMVDAGKIKHASGLEKRDMVIGAITVGIEEAFKELNKIPELAAASWDEMIRDQLLTLVPPVIKMLIDVEGKRMRFNPKIKGCFGCTK